jgi:hypothetical protein
VVVVVALRVVMVAVVPQTAALGAAATGVPLLTALTEQPILAAAQVVGGTQQTQQKMVELVGLEW